jgi:hypothetical protein
MSRHNSPGRLLEMIEPLARRVPLMSQRHTEPSSRGDTAKSSCSSCRGWYKAAPFTSIASFMLPSLIWGCSNQLTAIGPFRWMYSSYQLTRSPGNVGSQFAAIRTRSFSAAFGEVHSAVPGTGVCTPSTALTMGSSSSENRRPRRRLMPSRNEDSRWQRSRQKTSSRHTWRIRFESSCSVVICLGSRTVRASSAQHYAGRASWRLGKRDSNLQDTICRRISLGRDSKLDGLDMVQRSIERSKHG